MSQGEVFRTPALPQENYEQAALADRQFLSHVKRLASSHRQKITWLINLRRSTFNSMLKYHFYLLVLRSQPTEFCNSHSSCSFNVTETPVFIVSKSLRPLLVCLCIARNPVIIAQNWLLQRLSSGVAAKTLLREIHATSKPPSPSHIDIIPSITRWQWVAFANQGSEQADQIAKGQALQASNRCQIIASNARCLFGKLQQYHRSMPTSCKLGRH